MEKIKAWREFFSQEAKVDLGPPLQATTMQEGKLKLKIPRAITYQIMARGRLSLIRNIQGVRPNIDDVRRWKNSNGSYRGA